MEFLILLLRLSSEGRHYLFQLGKFILFKIKNKKNDCLELESWLSD